MLDDGYNQEHLLGVVHVTSIAVWLRGFAVTLVPFSENLGNVVTTTSSLDVYPTSLCTISLYTYVVFLKDMIYIIKKGKIIRSIRSIVDFTSDSNQKVG